MKKENLFRTALKLHSRLSFNGWAFPPLIVSIEITHRCNLRCKRCFQVKGHKKGEMTTQEIKNIIDQTPSYSLIILTGGEPFVREDFYEILEYALKRRCNILTNGTLITKRFTKLLNRLTLMGVSIDGVGPANDILRGGNYYKILDNVKDLTCPVDIKTTIMPENIDELIWISKLAHLLQADYFTLSLLKLSDFQHNTPYLDSLSDVLALEPKPAVYIPDVKNTIATIKEDSKVPVRFYPHNVSLACYFSDCLTVGDFYPCRIPYSIMYIGPYGDVYPCLSYRIGDIRDGLIKNWNSLRYRNFRKAMSKFQNCCIGCSYSEGKYGHIINRRNGASR